MRHYEVQSIELAVPYQKAFDFLSDNDQLPRWTNAFASVEGDRAVMRTPHGEVEIRLETTSSSERGTIDSVLTFPDGSVAHAFSRLIGDDRKSCYIFALTSPPVSLEALEGGLDSQSEILEEELKMAKAILENE